MADEGAPPAPPAPSGSLMWLLGGGVLLAAWWWEKKYGSRSIGSVAMGKILGEGDEDSEDDEDEDEDSGDAHDVEWTDAPIKRSRTRRKNALADIGGPITDAYITPIKLATAGDCEEAVRELEKTSRQGELIAGQRKKQVVRRALRRSAAIVTERCPKEVEELVGMTEDIQREVEREAGIQLPSTGRRFVPTREDFLVPGKHGARSFDPSKGLLVPRTRGEAGRFKKRAGDTTLEYRREGANRWRVIDLHTGEESRKSVPTGRPRGRPKKLT